MRFPHKAERVTHHKVVAPTKLDMMSYNNNNAGIPVGFRFHPTDEELVGFYLFGRVTTPPPDPREEDLRIIRELDLYRHEPWDLSEVCKIPGDHSVNQNNWYFFSHKDKKYPTGNRANRATKAGFWKATGRDKCIQTRGAVGMRKTLVFYRGRAPHGQKTDWIMHEFRLDDASSAPAPTGPHSSTSTPPGHRAHQLASFDHFHEGAGAWVVCRVFRKTKNLKSKGDNADTPTTSLEEDHQMALLPEITDSTEKFSSDEGEHVDYPPADHMVQHHFNTNYAHTTQHQHCKQELLSVADYAETGTSILPPQAFMFRSCSPNHNTFQALDHHPGAEFEHHHHMSMAPSSSAAGLFSPNNNSYLQAMLDDHVSRGDLRSLQSSYRSAAPAMLEGLEDFARFGGNPVSLLDQSLTDVVTRPLQHQSIDQLPNHDMVSFPLPWQPGPGNNISRSQGTLITNPTFVDFSDSVHTPFLSSGD